MPNDRLRGTPATFVFDENDTINVEDLREYFPPGINPLENVKLSEMFKNKRKAKTKYQDDLRKQVADLTEINKKLNVLAKSAETKLKEKDDRIAYLEAALDELEKDKV